MQQEVILKQDAIGSAEDYDFLKDAIKKLSVVSEEQFESIKKEKWYNRVFDMVTFSQKGKKRLAEQISTVAQAQQILIELLLRLAANDEEISKLVMECMVDIEKIQEQNIYMLKKIKKLQNLSLGIRKDTDISMLSEKNRDILSGCLYYVNGLDGVSSEAQQRFANAVIAYINSDVQMDNPLVGLEDIDTDSKRKILACCMEYIYLYDCSFDNIDKYEDFIAEFDFGQKTIQAVEKQVKALYALRGIDGLIEKYNSAEFEDIDDFFVLEIADVVEEDIDIGTMEDYEISEILHIAQDEVKKIRNKQVHLKAYVDCSGALEFEHCVIYYNENEADEITLHVGASLTIRNSSVVCKGADTASFITGKENNRVVIEKTTFENCSNFMSLSSCKKLSITKCELKNCGDKFLYVSMNSEAERFNVSENIIYENDIAGFNIEGMEYNPTLMRVSCYGRVCVFDNNEIVEAKEFSCIGRTEGDRKNSILYFSGDIKVTNCTFKGVSKGINATVVEKCRFQECQNTIETQENAKVEDCTFEECTRIIVAERGTKISACKFVSCYDELISVDWYGGVVIEFCQFTNIRYVDLPNGVKTGVKFWGNTSRRRMASITLFCSKDSNSKYNSIRNCIFDDVVIGKDYFLITAYGYEKPKGTVSCIEECTFTNCKTARSTGEIIKEYISYDTVFKKDQSFRANEIKNCKGLDRVVKVSEESKKV